MEYRIPKEFDTVSKELLQDSAGRLFRDYRKSLEPDFLKVWLHLTSAYAALVLIAWGIVRFSTLSATLFWISVILGAFFFGYTIAFIQLFFHEAAHYNLASDRSTSDRLANAAIGAIVGQDIRNYRPIHWDHHRLLGTVMDTEQTYFDPLNTKFVIESLVGIKVLNVLLKREKKLEADPKGQKKHSMIGMQLIAGLAINGSIALSGLLFHRPALTVAWVVGMLTVFPFFASLRQVLEHRDEEARADTDYHKVAHGVINRLFGDGIIADTLGGAGFNRHLLHHWDPQISYTRLKDLEVYLMDTPMASALKGQQTTYFRTFLRLLNN